MCHGTKCFSADNGNSHCLCLLAMKSVQKEQEYALEQRSRALSKLSSYEKEKDDENLPQKNSNTFLEQNNDIETDINSSDNGDIDFNESQNTCADMFDVFKWSTATPLSRTKASSSSPRTSSTKSASSVSTVVVRNTGRINKNSRKSKQEQGDGTRQQQRKLMTSQEYYLKRQTKRSRARIIESILPASEGTKKNGKSDTQALAA
mmetsp:Transcript_2632/g.3837  ORF Transcript_2632/g.3837 Transcript_2632/m.3837 type:complete len:205 (+) Transcript_2632:246-860(+)